MESGKEHDFLYCSSCSAKLRKDCRYCWQCQADQQIVGPHTDWVQSGSAGPSGIPPQSFGRPTEPRKAMSFDAFCKAKSINRQDSIKQPSKKLKKADVSIFIGRKQLSEDKKLKTMWGKRLPVTVPIDGTYAIILDRAVNKWQAFDRNFSSEETYVLVYDDGRHAQFMPGGHENFFNLLDYKNELGKDFKRITLYLCSLSDHMVAEGLTEPSSGAGDIGEDKIAETATTTQSWLEPNWYDFVAMHDEPVSIVDSNQLNGSNETIAQSLQVNLTSSGQREQGHEGIEDIISILKSKVDKERHFFLVCRRSAPLARVFRLWQREAKVTPVTGTVRLKYSGEDGIDQGAIAKEFFTECVRSIGKEMFPNGTPKISTYHIQNGNFQACGEIIAASIAQGGPLPLFLEECAYDAIHAKVNMLDIEEQNLTKHEIETLKEIKKDCAAHTDIIIDNNYTGPINQDHCEDIIKSLKVSFVSQRQIYMSEFSTGLNAYGLKDLIIKSPEICSKLFVINKMNQNPDANYLFSIISPVYSTAGSVRRKIEEETMDLFQDMLLQIEDTKVCGHEVAVAWQDFEEAEESENASNEMMDRYQSPEVSIPGIMGWLTGQQHKPIDPGEPFQIICNFDHDCLVRNPVHKLCFPVVGACGRELTLPVKHMQTADTFFDVFIMAYCKGNSFGRH
eukprot:gene11620-12817_t